MFRQGAIGFFLTPVFLAGCASDSANDRVDRDAWLRQGGEVRASLPAGSSRDRADVDENENDGVAGPTDTFSVLAASLDEMPARLQTMRDASARERRPAQEDPFPQHRRTPVTQPERQQPQVGPEAEIIAAEVIASQVHAQIEAQLGARQGDVPAADERPIVRALAAAAGAVRDPEAPFDPSAFGVHDEEEATLARNLHEAFREIGRQLAAGAPAIEATASLAGLVESLTPSESLALPRFELCSKVEGFGQLSPIETKRFLPGRSNQVILYTEVTGFASERDSRGQWTTRLSTRVAIFARHDGTQVWSRDWSPITDESVVRRQDFFICEKVTLSEHLTLGTYVLRTSIRDERSGAIAEKSLEFQMVADPALVAR